MWICSAHEKLLRGRASDEHPGLGLKVAEGSFIYEIWFKEAIRRLNDSGLFVLCEDVDALEMDLNEKACAVEYAGEVPRVLDTKYASPWP